jgi:colanic acid/amylovoran biosynthesis glycosyltransferase
LGAESSEGVELDAESCMRIVYVTSTLPYGSREAFLIPEVAELMRSGHDVTVVPMSPRGVVVHEDVQPFLATTVGVPLLSPEILREAFAGAVSSPRRTFRALGYVCRSRSPRIFAKNLGVFAKGVWLGRRVCRLRADHLHAHWASTSSTMALVAAEISGVPWSFTAHRWDIAENNLLEIKAGKACFVRAISEKGARAVASQLGTPARQLRVLHLGIAVSVPPRSRTPVGDLAQFKVVMVADFVEVKGHRYLLEALQILVARGRAVHVDLAGDGPLREELEHRIESARLSDVVTVLGTVPHTVLLDDLRSRRWDAVVLPSIVTATDEEGIPVSLMEAMGAGVPVISTRTGAVPELLGDGAGLLVDGGDPIGLAVALEALARDPSLRERFAEEGHRRVLEHFNIRIVASDLATCFQKCVTR